MDMPNCSYILNDCAWRIPLCCIFSILASPFQKVQLYYTPQVKDRGASNNNDPGGSYTSYAVHFVPREMCPTLLTDEYYAWVLQWIAKAVSFLNNDCKLGRFEILSLSGSFMLSEIAGQRSRTSGLSVALSGPDGRVLGGNVAGLLTAASPVQVPLPFSTLRYELNYHFWAQLMCVFINMYVELF